ncbi:hypothetical protein EZV62_028129 [Acer yangbiense]|uniref:ABC transporter domain-containing protein n=1 Tax=Acer yangbiense TaxID=1000413 RepID=A0A5C7GQ76_9ROSI|nr:hypothetical protein EZV62_028129 [Acer yangbiense]
MHCSACFMSVWFYGVQRRGGEARDNGFGDWGSGSGREGGDSDYYMLELPQNEDETRLCIVFLAFDVAFVVICVAVTCLIGIAVCCCLPCILGILYALTEWAAKIAHMHINLSAHSRKDMRNRWVEPVEEQKIKLSVDRAVLLNPSILLLDEVTGGLDFEAERAVKESLDLLMFGHSTIIIARRLSLIRNADYIAVMNEELLKALVRTLIDAGGYKVEHPVTQWIAKINLQAAQVAVGIGIPLWQIPEEEEKTSMVKKPEASTKLTNDGCDDDVPEISGITHFDDFAIVYVRNVYDLLLINVGRVAKIDYLSAFLNSELVLLAFDGSPLAALMRQLYEAFLNSELVLSAFDGSPPAILTDGENMDTPKRKSAITERVVEISVEDERAFEAF